jgi:hypothetical protein
VDVSNEMINRESDLIYDAPKQGFKHQLKKGVTLLLSCFRSKQKLPKEDSDAKSMDKTITAVDPTTSRKNSDFIMLSKTQQIEYPSLTDDSDEDAEFDRISGFLPAGYDLQHGEGESSEAEIFRDFESIAFGEFLVDSLVDSKRRCSTIRFTTKWSKEEDTKLMKYAKRFAHNWQQISKKLGSEKQIGNKTADECRKRWMALSKGHDYNWTQEADDRLLELVTKFGKEWSLLSKYFDGLHKDNIRNRYNKLLKEGRFPSEVFDQKDRTKKCRIIKWKDLSQKYGGVIKRIEDDILSIEITTQNGSLTKKHRLSLYDNKIVPQPKENIPEYPTKFIKAMNVCICKEWYKAISNTISYESISDNLMEVDMFNDLLENEEIDRLQPGHA